MEITLEQMLKSRDERHERQQRLLQQHPGMTLVCMTTIMPGPVKRNMASLVTAHAGLTELLTYLGGQLRDVTVLDLPTGYEAYLIVDRSPMRTKVTTCAIEDSHPIGRLMDIDVIGHDGVPISRKDAGQQPRRCLLCEHEAQWCMRNHTHSREELKAKIDQMIADYVQ